MKSHSSKHRYLFYRITTCLNTKQEGQRCPKRQVAQATIRIATAVNLETKKEMLGYAVKVNVLDVLRKVKLVI